MNFIIRFSMVSATLFFCSCASGPNNTVGAAYDADSGYCRELIQKANQTTRIPYNTPSSPNQPPPSDRQLYEQMCEPVGAWQARDRKGHDSTVAYENSLFSKVVEFFR
jgi:hypothetical protein